MATNAILLLMVQTQMSKHSKAIVAPCCRATQMTKMQSRIGWRVSELIG